MGTGHDDGIHSEQEDLVGTSSSELDDAEDDEDLSDTDGMHFNLCKTSGASLSLVDSATDWNSSTQEYRNVQHQHQLHLQHFRRCKRTFLLLIVYGLGLMATSFSIFIVVPLYQKQLEVGRKNNNAYGSILFISPIVTLLLVFLAYSCSWIFKWTTQVYKFPMPIKRLLLISLCCGIAGTLCTVSSYKRVPCHLQDPLKGAALVYSLVFYFFFCKKVMGLQKIFSATTAVVGLFISVDYGLCDEFRCHGKDMSELNKGQNNEGWQGRAVWTLLYIIGITLWTLHLSLLEGNIIMVSTESTTSPTNNLLATISRLVSNSDRVMDSHHNHQHHHHHHQHYHKQYNHHPQDGPSQNQKHRPKPIHLAAWIHIASLLVMLTFGLIDIVPGSGSMKSFSQHWTDVGNTFICHFGIQPSENSVKGNRQNEALEYLSNLTPGSAIYNQTVQKLRRNKRSIENRNLRFFHRKLGHHVYEMEHMPIYGKPHGIVALKKYKNSNSSTQTPLISRLIINTSEMESGQIDCGHLSSYAWLFIAVYLGFILCVFNFLDISESAVFTIAVITAALPYIGLFWSSFKLEASNGTAYLIWAPSISGELICSLLGAPIVFLGLILLFRAHFSDILRPPCRSSNPYTSLQNA